MPLLSKSLKNHGRDESGAWVRLGQVHLIYFRDDETEVLVIKESATKKEITLDAYVLEGNWEGVMFEGSNLKTSGNIMNTGLVQAKILSHDVVKKIDIDNPLDKALIEMGALDELLRDLTKE